MRLAAVGVVAAAVAAAGLGQLRWRGGARPVGAAEPARGEPQAAALLFGGRLDLNTATEADLVALPGIGPTRAARIVAERARRGGRFEDVDDLLDVPGIGPGTLARLRDQVTVSPPSTTRRDGAPAPGTP